MDADLRTWTLAYLTLILSVAVVGYALIVYADWHICMTRAEHSPEYVVWNWPQGCRVEVDGEMVPL